MKKKVIAVSLAALMALSLAACSSSGSGSSETTAAETTAEEKEGLGDEIAEAAASAVVDAAESEAEEAGDLDEDNDTDLKYVSDKGSLVVGITDFEPMDYQDDNGSWIGFDADLATAFTQMLGVDIEFVEIDWDNKILELNGKTIDCVWNGMTLTDEVTSSMECSKAYMNNAQVVVVNASDADQYQDVDSISGLTFAVEAGSAGQAVIEDLGYNFTQVDTQSSALMEVAAGTSDAAVIDALMAEAMVGEGTGYADLTYTVSLNSEEYGVGFRKGSDLADALDQFLTDSYENGTIQDIADKYGVGAALIDLSK